MRQDRGPQLLAVAALVICIFMLLPAHCRSLRTPSSDFHDVDVDAPRTSPIGEPEPPRATGGPQ